MENVYFLDVHRTDDEHAPYRFHKLLLLLKEYGIQEEMKDITQNLTQNNVVTDYLPTLDSFDEIEKYIHKIDNGRKSQGIGYGDIRAEYFVYKHPDFNLSEPLPITMYAIDMMITSIIHRLEKDSLSSLVSDNEALAAKEEIIKQLEKFQENLPNYSEADGLDEDSKDFAQLIKARETGLEHTKDEKTNEVNEPAYLPTLYFQGFLKIMKDHQLYLPFQDLLEYKTSKQMIEEYLPTLECLQSVLDEIDDIGRFVGEKENKYKKSYKFAPYYAVNNRLHEGYDGICITLDILKEMIDEVLCHIKDHRVPTFDQTDYQMLNNQKVIQKLEGLKKCILQYNDNQTRIFEKDIQEKLNEIVKETEALIANDLEDNITSTDRKCTMNTSMNTFKVKQLENLTPSAYYHMVKDVVFKMYGLKEVFSEFFDGLDESQVLNNHLSDVHSVIDIVRFAKAIDEEDIQSDGHTVYIYDEETSNSAIPTPIKFGKVLDIIKQILSSTLIELDPMCNLDTAYRDMVQKLMTIRHFIHEATNVGEMLVPCEDYNKPSVDGETGEPIEFRLNELVNSNPGKIEFKYHQEFNEDVPVLDAFKNTTDFVDYYNTKNLYIATDKMTGEQQRLMEDYMNYYAIFWTHHNPLLTLQEMTDKYFNIVGVKR